MRISLPSSTYGFALVLLAVLAGVLFELALPSDARAAEACPNEQVRQESNVNPSTSEPYDMGLPECRAYEMVSPENKAGHNVGIEAPLQAPAAAEGGAVVYVSQGEFAEPEGGSAVFKDNNYRAVRGESGWSSFAEFLPASIAPITALSLETGLLFTSDLSRMAVCGAPGEGSAVTEPALVCAIHESDGSWVASPTFHNVPGSAAGEASSSDSVSVYAASSDLSRIFFILHGKARLLASDTQTGSIHNAETGSGIYELAGLGTGSPVTLRLVNVDNNDVEIGSTVPLLGNSTGENPDGTDLHAVSESGETVYFVATPVGGVQTLYARVAAAHTVPVSEPLAIDCAECQTGTSLQKPAEFQGASPDGSRAYFTTEQELLPGHTTKNLYEYNADAPAGYQISDISGGSSEANVQGVLRSSGDGSHIYFVARGILTKEPNAEGQEAQLGADNLYVYEQDSAYPAGRTMFVTMLCSAHETSGSVTDAQCPGAAANDSELWAESDRSTNHEVHLTRDGEYMVFETYAHLSSEDTNEALAVYRYDAKTGELTWVSHAALDFTAHVNEAKSAGVSAIRGQETGSNPDLEDLARSVSENGEDVIFSTEEKLQADDVSKATQIYLWHDGTVSMISDGHSYSGLTTMMSASGSDIYFLTNTQLVGQDTDQDIDMYDARVDGGYPAPAAPPVECGLREEGEACQGALASQPLFAAPGSASFTSGANLMPAVGGETTKPSTTKSKPLTRAQKRAKALKACRKQPKKKRALCEAQARKRYGAKVKAKSKAKPKHALKATKSNRRGN